MTMLDKWTTIFCEILGEPPKRKQKNTVECHYFIVIKMYDNMGAQFSFNCLRNIALVQNVLEKFK